MKHCNCYIHDLGVIVVVVFVPIEKNALLLIHSGIKKKLTTNGLYSMYIYKE